MIGITDVVKAVVASVAIVDFAGEAVAVGRTYDPSYDSRTTSDLKVDVIAQASSHAADARGDVGAKYHLAVGIRKRVGKNTELEAVDELVEYQQAVADLLMESEFDRFFVESVDATPLYDWKTLDERGVYVGALSLTITTTS